MSEIERGWSEWSLAVETTLTRHEAQRLLAEFRCQAGQRDYCPVHVHDDELNGPIYLTSKGRELADVESVLRDAETKIKSFVKPQIAIDLFALFMAFPKHDGSQEYHVAFTAYEDCLMDAIEAHVRKTLGEKP